MRFRRISALAYTVTILMASCLNTSFAVECLIGNINTGTGQALVGMSYDVFTAVNYSECLTECVRSTGCKSLNFLMTNGKCDLNSETKDTRPDLYVRKENSIYTTKTANHQELMEPRISTPQTQTTQPPTTQSPATQTTTSETTTTQSPTTQTTTSETTTTQSPTTQTTTSETTTTQSPATQTTTSETTTTQSPTTQTTTSETTTTQSPTTQTTTSETTTTQSPTTQTTTSETTTTQSPTTQTTTSETTTTQSPTTKTTTSETTTTQSPTTQTTTAETTTTQSPTTQTTSTETTTTEKPTTAETAQVSYPLSCLQILRNGNSVGDGVYLIDPSRSGIPIQAYCDMTTDGGGWTIIKRTIFQTATPPQNKRFQTYEVISEFNTNDKNIYPTTTALLDIKQKIGFHQIHFYCHKQSVGRVLSIRTRNDTVGHQVVRYYTDDDFAMTNFVAACESFDRLPEDTSQLGQNCAKWNKDTGTWGKSSGDSRTLSTTFYIKSINGYGCSVNPPKVEYCACDDDILAPLPYNPQDRWQISVR